MTPDTYSALFRRSRRSRWYTLGMAPTHDEAFALMRTCPAKHAELRIVETAQLDTNGQPPDPHFEETMTATTSWCLLYRRHKLLPWSKSITRRDPPRASRRDEGHAAGAAPAPRRRGDGFGRQADTPARTTA